MRSYCKHFWCSPSKLSSFTSANDNCRLTPSTWTLIWFCLLCNSHWNARTINTAFVDLDVSNDAFHFESVFMGVINIYASTDKLPSRLQNRCFLFLLRIPLSFECVSIILVRFESTEKLLLGLFRKCVSLHGWCCGAANRRCESAKK